MARAWRTLMCTFTGLIFLLPATGPTADEKKEMAVSFKVFCLKELSIEDGEDAIVRCYLDPRTSAKHMEIGFNYSAQNLVVHLYKEGADNSSNQDPQFKNRTFLRIDRIHEGHFQLLIRRVGPKDSGNYTVFIKSKYYFSTFPFSLTVTECLLKKQSCLWELVYAVMGTLVICAIPVSIYLIHDCWSKRKLREAAKSYLEGKRLLLDQPIDPESQNLQNQMASERSCQQHAMTPFSEVDIVLDNRNPSSKLWVSEDRKSVKLQNNGPDASNPCNEAFANSFVLGCEGFKQGKYRWEVEVGCATLWAVGIALESVSQKGLSQLAPDEGVWAVGLTAGQYRAFTTPVTALSQKDQLERVEVYLDVEGGQLSFYNSGTKQHIYSHIGHYTDKVLPFFWTMDPNNHITVCLPAAADNGKVSA